MRPHGRSIRWLLLSVACIGLLPEWPQTQSLPQGGSFDNQGQIPSTAGNVYLIGRTEQNEGTIAAPMGSAGLAGGQDVLIAVDAGGSGSSMKSKLQ